MFDVIMPVDKVNQQPTDLSYACSQLAEIYNVFYSADDEKPNVSSPFFSYTDQNINSELDKKYRCAFLVRQLYAVLADAFREKGYVVQTESLYPIENPSSLCNLSFYPGTSIIFVPRFTS